MFERILIIDDHLEIGAYIGDLIAEMYPEVRILKTCDGREGIMVATAKKPQVILLDTHMPVMDGYEVARVLQSQRETHSIPIIAMTLSGYEQSSTLANLLPYCQTVLYKPFKPEQLASAINHSLSNQYANRPLPVFTHTRSNAND